MNPDLDYISNMKIGPVRNEWLEYQPLHITPKLYQFSKLFIKLFIKTMIKCKEFDVTIVTDKKNNGNKVL